MTFDLKILNEADFIALKKKIANLKGASFLTSFYKDNYIVASFEFDDYDVGKYFMEDIISSDNGFSLTNAYDESNEKHMNKHILK